MTSDQSSGGLSVMLGQMIRFGITGGVSTVIYAIIYLALADYVLPQGWAVLAVPPAFLAAAAYGFWMHSNWSFKDHGTRDSSGRQHVKFLVVQSLGMLLNALFTWVLTAVLHTPNWVPLIPAVLITPFVTFTLNRQWVFG